MRKRSAHRWTQEEVARLHSTSVERLQGSHQISVEAEKERVTTYEGIKDLQYLPRSIVLGHIPTSRPRDEDTESGVAPCKVGWQQSRICI